MEMTSSDIAALSGPILLQPLLKRRIWGGSKLLAQAGKEMRGPIGESWLAVDMPGLTNPIAGNSMSGMTLADLFRLSPEKVLGSSLSRWGNIEHFPLFVKLIETSKKLSLFVHSYRRPDNGLELPAKSEAWYILHAEPDAEVYLGLTKSFEEEELRSAVLSGEIEKYIRAVKVKEGDCISVPTGVIHGLGKGLVVAEISLAFEVAYRLYNWNCRPWLELQLEDALAHVDKQKTSSASARHLRMHSDEKSKVLISAENFRIVKYLLDAKDRICLDSEGKTFHLVFVVSGGMAVAAGGNFLELSRWESCFVPACCGKYELRGIRTNSVVLVFSS